MNALRSEFRKLLSVRSTYFNVLICMAIVMFIAGFIQGFHADPKTLLPSNVLENQSTGAVEFVGFILAFVGLLLAGHEYRYNTIYYTLTSINRRYKILLSKFIVITIFSLVTVGLIVFFSPLCTIIGVHLAHKHLGPQTFQIMPMLWHCLFCGWAYAMYAFILLMILRNQIGAIVTFLLFPLIGENILMLLLKSKGNYLPFTAAQSVVDPATKAGGVHATTEQAVITVLIYVVVGMAVSAFLFIRRDAN